ncbi:hypothetical protein [Ornithinimicrobium avium]|nr:hypothetical protein [Ornithinimicrobium avium]
MRVIVTCPPAEDDLPCDDCTMPDAMPWLLLATAWPAGLALTAGWTVRTAWAVAHNPDALRWLLR